MVGTAPDTWLVPRWLGDGRRAVLRLGERILLMDMESGEARVLTDDLDAGSGFLSLPRDGHAIYAVRRLVEGDIWLASLK